MTNKAIYFLLVFVMGGMFTLVYDQVKLEKRIKHVESVTFGGERCPK